MCQTYLHYMAKNTLTPDHHNYMTLLNFLFSKIIALCMAGSQSTFQFILNVVSGVEILALCRSLKFHHTKLFKLCLYGLCFVHRGIFMLEQEKGLPNCCHKVRSRRCLHIFVCYSIITIHRETKQPQIIIPPMPDFILVTVHSSRSCSFGICQTQKVIHQTSRWWSVIHIPRERINFTPLQPVLSIGQR